MTDQQKMDVILAAARAHFRCPDLIFNETTSLFTDPRGHSAWPRYNVYGELHTGVDEDAGSYQILNTLGEGEVEIRFFKKG